MKTNTSIVKNLGAAALVFTVTNNSVSAAQVDAEISSVSAAVQQALAGADVENMSDMEIQNMLEVSIPRPTSSQIDETQNYNHAMTAEPARSETTYKLAKEAFLGSPRRSASHKYCK